MHPGGVSLTSPVKSTIDEDVALCRKHRSANGFFRIERVMPAARSTMNRVGHETNLSNKCQKWPALVLMPVRAAHPGRRRHHRERTIRSIYELDPTTYQMPSPEYTMGSAWASRPLGDPSASANPPVRGADL